MPMRRFVALLLLWLFAPSLAPSALASAAWADPKRCGTLVVKVLNEREQPVARALVSVAVGRAERQSLGTDSSGVAYFKNLRAGPASFMVEAEGFAPVSHDDVIVPDGRQVVFRLERALGLEDLLNQ